MTSLALCYLLVGIIYLVLEIFYVKKVKKLQMVSVFRVMYAFIYGFLPAATLFRMESGDTTVTMMGSESLYVSNLSIALVISIIEYAVFSFFYKHTAKSKCYEREYNTPSVSVQKISLSFIIVFGVVSLFLWTRAFGSIWNFILNADAIRANYSTIYNPYAFMEHFTKVFMVAFFISISLYITEKSRKKNTRYSLFLIVASLFFALVVMLCTDARGPIGMMIVVTMLYYFNDKMARGKINVKKTIIRMVVVVLIAFIAIVASEGIMNTIRGKDVDVLSTVDIFKMLETEFGYTVNSQVAAVDQMFLDPFGSMFFNDTVRAIFSWIPSRFIPFELPTDLWDLNTNILNEYYTFSGQAPTDFVTASLYMFGLPGVFLLPAIFGTVLKKLETIFRRVAYSPYLMAIYARMMYYCMWWVSHFSFEYTALSMFGLFLVHMATVFFKRVLKKKAET